MKPISAKLVGFDMRCSKAYSEAEWPTERREQFLLVPEILWPLSVDEAVWPTVFVYSSSASKKPWPPITKPIDRGYTVDGLWSNLPLMRKIYESSRTDRAVQAIEIAVALFADEKLIESNFQSPLVDKQVVSTIVPPEVPSQNSFLGFDIADSRLYSGLSNCSYSLADWKSLRTEWASKLNKNGLIEKFDDAMRFRETTDQRVPEHAPFWVFGLSQLT
jgi:hypothetical protein